MGEAKSAIPSVQQRWRISACGLIRPTGGAIRESAPPSVILNKQRVAFSNALRRFRTQGRVRKGAVSQTILDPGSRIATRSRRDACPG
jgi:hypothetical protein